MNLEKFGNFPAREHLFQNAAMIYVGKPDQVARKPSVELCPARPTTFQSPIDLGSNLVVFATKSAVSLHVALLEQHLQQDRLGVQRVTPSAREEMRLAQSGDKARSDELQTIAK
jgi:hypothetical protein